MDWDAPWLRWLFTETAALECWSKHYHGGSAGRGASAYTEPGRGGKSAIVAHHDQTPARLGPRREGRRREHYRPRGGAQRDHLLHRDAPHQCPWVMHSRASGPGASRAAMAHNRFGFWPKG